MIYYTVRQNISFFSELFSPKCDWSFPDFVMPNTNAATHHVRILRKLRLMRKRDFGHICYAIMA